jgi:hypothetical protein
MEQHSLHPLAKFQLSRTSFGVSKSTQSQSQSKTAILIAKVKCQIIVSFGVYELIG